MIRECSEADLTSLMQIEKSAQVSPWTDNTFERCWELGYQSWVTTIENKIVGFIIISVQGRECHILNLCVHPTCQGQGLGRELLQFVLDWVKSRGINILFLEVRRGNSPAIKLYHKMGFVQIGVRKNYYPTETGAEDALVLAMDLKGESQ